MLDDADRLYIRDMPDDDLREEMQYTNDFEYKSAIAHELLTRARKKAADTPDWEKWQTIKEAP